MQWLRLTAIIAIINLAAEFGGQIMRVNMLAGFDISRCRTNGKAIFNNTFAFGDVGQRDFMPRRYGLLCSELGERRGQGGTLRQRLQCHHYVVTRVHLQHLQLLADICRCSQCGTATGFLLCAHIQPSCPLSSGGKLGLKKYSPLIWFARTDLPTPTRRKYIPVGSIQASMPSTVGLGQFDSPYKVPRYLT